MVTRVHAATLFFVPPKKSSPTSSLPVPVQLIERRVYLIRGHKVMLDAGPAGSDEVGLTSADFRSSARRGSSPTPEPPAEHLGAGGAVMEGSSGRTRNLRRGLSSTRLSPGLGRALHHCRATAPACTASYDATVLLSCDRRCNPEGCEKVAGGRSGAKTSGHCLPALRAAKFCQLHKCDVFHSATQSRVFSRFQTGTVRGSSDNSPNGSFPTEKGRTNLCNYVRNS